jgi:hypothetical protein
MIMQRDTRQEINVLHFEKSAWTAGDLFALANALLTWWSTYYKPTVGPWVQLVQISVRLYDPAAPISFDLGVSPAVVGTGSGNELPANVTSTVSWRSGLAGRRFRGRIYHAGHSTSEVTTTDTITGTKVTALANLANHLITDIFNAVAASLVVWHKDTNLYTQVLGFVIENILDSQRRRLPGRGR